MHLVVLADLCLLTSRTTNYIVIMIHELRGLLSTAYYRVLYELVRCSIV